MERGKKSQIDVLPRFSSSIFLQIILHHIFKTTRYSYSLTGFALISLDFLLPVLLECITFGWEESSIWHLVCVMEVYTHTSSVWQPVMVQSYSLCRVRFIVWEGTWTWFRFFRSELLGIGFNQRSLIQQMQMFLGWCLPDAYIAFF